MNWYDFKSINLYLTEYCPNNCYHCFLSKEQRRNKKVLELEKIKKILYTIPENKYYEINIMGGEILSLDKDYLFKFFKILEEVKKKKNNLFFKLNINLINYKLDNNKYIDIINKLRIIDEIATSYDYGINRFNEYKYKLWLDNIEILKDRKINININIVIQKFLILNLDNVFKDIKYLFKNYNIKNYAITPYIINDPNLFISFKSVTDTFIKFYNFFEKELKLNPLKDIYPYNSIYNSLKNNIKPTEDFICQMINGFSISPNEDIYLCYTNIKETTILTLKDIKNDVNLLNKNKNYLIFKHNLKKRIYNIQECNNCKYFDYCLGSCYVNYKYYKEHPEEECWGYKGLWKFIEEKINNN